MRPRKDRNIEGVSLSFLDVISCGFGAVILLLVLTRVFDPVTIDPSVTDLNGYLEKLQEELIELKGETLLLNRTLIRREDQKAEEIDQLTRVTSEQADIEAAISSVSKNDEADDPTEALETCTLKQEICEVLCLLTPREEKVLRMRYGIGEPTNYSLEEIGSRFNLTRERIRQIEIKALRKLRHAKRRHALESFV